MNANATVPFARYGGEKMIYDGRTGPVAINVDGSTYVAYQGGRRGPEGHPHLIRYDRTHDTWSAPQRVGTVSSVNHHLGPILWTDASGLLHVLYNCHISGKAQKPVAPVHLMSPTTPREMFANTENDPSTGIPAWIDGGVIAPSISYPRCLRLADRRWVLYYRVFGHMGYWTYRVSENGSDGWEGGVPLVDFDRDPVTNKDTWAGSYHTVQPGNDGEHLHVTFCYWDESQTYNRRYNQPLGFSNRYDLYYMKVSVVTGTATTADGSKLDLPVNRHRAAQCRVASTEHHITNAATMMIDREDRPSFLLPVSGSTPWDCLFIYVRSERERDDRLSGQHETGPSDVISDRLTCASGWRATAVAPTNSVWSGSLLTRNKANTLQAYLIAGTDDGSSRVYGGGQLELWESTDGGRCWHYRRNLNPHGDRLFNNPRPVIGPGSECAYAFDQGDRGFVCFGWPGPKSLWEVQRQAQTSGSLGSVNAGEAYLWLGGRWVNGGPPEDA